MKRKEFLNDAISRIDEAFLEEADLYNRSEKERKSRRRSRGAELIAAAAVIALVAALLIVPVLLIQQGPGTVMEDNEKPGGTVSAPADTAD